MFRAVESVLAGTSGCDDFEFILVDNGSGAAFRRSLGELPATVRVLDEAKPGPAAARNTGIAAATGEVLFFIDADCVAEPGWVAAGLAGLNETGADILRGSSGMIGSTNAARLIAASFRKRVKSRPGDRVRLDSRNMVARRRVFDSLDFNDASIRGEDIELGMRAEALGFRTAYWPAMRVSHEHEERLDTFLAKKVVGGWHLRAVAMTSPELRWPMRRPMLLPRFARATRNLPGQRLALAAVVLGVVRAGALLDRVGRLAPTRAGGIALKALGSGASSVGAALHDGGYDAPSWQEALHGRTARRERRHA